MANGPSWDHFTVKIKSISSKTRAPEARKSLAHTKASACEAVSVGSREMRSSPVGCDTTPPVPRNREENRNSVGVAINTLRPRRGD